MIYAYIRVSTDKQTTENQQFELLKFADQKAIRVDEWIHETVSGTKRYADRSLGPLIQRLTSEDTLIVTELSRLGRSLMEVMSILNVLMEKQVRVLSVKEGYELGDNINSKVLAFAFSLSAEIERSMISARTKEALARKRGEGTRLGRPKGSLSKKTKLTGREDEIRMLLERKVSVAAIARIMEVHRITLANFIASRRLRPADDRMKISQGP